MHVFLTPAADKFLAEIMAQGYDDPALVIETALAKMAQEETADDDSEYVAWVQEQCKDALVQIDQGKTVPFDLSKIKVIAQQHIKEGRKVNASVIP